MTQTVIVNRVRKTIEYHNDNYFGGNHICGNRCQFRFGKYQSQGCSLFNKELETILEMVDMYFPIRLKECKDAET